MKETVPALNCNDGGNHAHINDTNNSLDVSTSGSVITCIKVNSSEQGEMGIVTKGDTNQSISYSSNLYQQKNSF